LNLPEPMPIQGAWSIVLRKSRFTRQVLPVRRGGRRFSSKLFSTRMTTAQGSEGNFRVIRFAPVFLATLTARLGARRD